EAIRQVLVAERREALVLEDVGSRCQDLLLTLAHWREAYQVVGGFQAGVVQFLVGPGLRWGPGAV
ncbi:MAG: hypothetical protein ACJA0V_003666, partial [Planctomycetota bacterium]